MKRSPRFARKRARHPRAPRRLRAFGLVAGIAIVALTSSGCIAIKSQDTSQRAPGVIALLVEICLSDRDQSVPTSNCDPDLPATEPKGVEEPDHNQQDVPEGDEVLKGQVLIAFRVPDGSTGPDRFDAAGFTASFTRSPTYTDELRSDFPPTDGFHWEGYISTPTDLDPADPVLASVAPEFTLPPGANGEPFDGPYQWRAVAGFRGTDPADPVVCGNPAQPGYLCVDTPRHATVPVNLPAPASDFSVVNGIGATAGHGQTATVSFPVRYRDENGKGPLPLSLTATTSMPNTSAAPSLNALTAAPNDTTTVNVTVPVPPGTRLGSYTVTLSASTGNPEVTRSNTATITVVDRLAPSIRIPTPAQGAAFRFGQVVAADYVCTDEFNGTGLRTCSGPVAVGAPIDTGSLGTKQFTVNASDRAGNASSTTRTYQVLPRQAPNISLSFDVEAFTRFTKFTRIQLKRVPEGSKVRVTCKVKRRKCPGKARKAFTKKDASGTVNLKSRFKGPKLRVGTKLTARVSKLGSIGAVRVAKIRSRKIPKVTDRCMLPATSKLRKTC